MRNLSLSALLLVMCLLAEGCVLGPKAMNSQRSAIRGLGDTAVTASLDFIKNDASAEAVRVKTKEVAIAVQLFLKDGKVADLTLPEFTESLRKIIPVEYQFLFDIMMAQIQGITVDVGVIGADNVERVNSMCVGLLRGCDLYVAKYRPVTEVVRALENKKASDAKAVASFGVTLKKRLKVK